MIQGGSRDLHAVLGAHMYEFVTNKKNRINTEYGGRGLGAMLGGTDDLGTDHFHDLLKQRYVYKILIYKC